MSGPDLRATRHLWDELTPTEDGSKIKLLLSDLCFNANGQSSDFD